MRLFVSAVILCVATIATAAEFDPFKNLFAPPARVDNWMAIVWAGDVNHPIMPVYYLTEQRKAAPLTRYVKLAPSEYQSLVDFSRSASCSRELISSKPPYPSTIVIREYSNRRAENLCVFPRERGCEYLFSLARLPGIDWSRKDTWPLFQFEAELGCKGPLTRWRDPEGRLH